MATITANVGTFNWNPITTAAWAGGVIPTAADDVVIPSGSSLTSTSGTGVVCRSLTIQSGGTIAWSAPGAIIRIGDASGGALNISSGATVNTAVLGSFSFESTTTNGGAGWPITTNGKTLPNVTFNGVGGKWTLQDALTCSVLTVTAGHFDSGSQNISATRFLSSNTNVRTISLGSSIVSLSTDADLSSVGGLTWSPNTAVLRFGTQNGISSGNQFDYQGLSLEYTAIGSFGASLFGAGVFKDLTVVGAAPTAFLNLNNNPVFTGTVSLSGNSSTNRLLVQSNTLGTPRVINATATSLTDVDFMDIAIVGPVGSTITSDSFNRADGALAGSTSDAADGGAGLVWSGYSHIVTNRVRMVNYNPSWVDLGVANQYVEAIFSWDAGATGYWGVMLRYSASNSNIVFVVYPNLSNYTIGYLNNSGASFVSTNSPGAWVSGDKMGVAVVGNIYLIYRNNVLVLSGVLPSNAPTTGAGAGFSCIGNASNKEYVDNFKAYPIPNVTGTRLGDCLGNSGIEFTTASGTARDGGGVGVKRYAVAAGNFSSTAMWSETSGGSPGASVPLPQDDVYLDANSAAGTYAINMPRSCRNLDCTGFTRTLNNSASDWSLYGNLKIVPGMTWSFTSIGPNLRGRGTQTIDTSGIVPGGGITNTNIISPGGSYTLLSNLSLGLATQSYFGHFAGTFNANGFDVTTGRIDSPGSLVRTLNLGSGTWRVGYNTPFVVSISATTSLVADSSTIIVDSVYTAERSFTAPTGSVFGTLTYTVADSPGALTITGSNTFGTVNIGSGRSLKLTSGTTQKIGTLNLNGVPRGGVRLVDVSGSYLSTLDSAAVSLSDLDIRVRVLLSDWTPATTTPFVTKQTGASAATISYNFYLDTSGNLALRCADGAAYSTATSTVVTGITDGAAAWVRVARRMSDGRVQFFTAADSSTMPSSWTQLGADAANSRTQDTADPVLFGAGYSGTGVAQTLRRVQMRNNVLDDGTGIVFDTDFSNQFGPFYVDSANGAPVTPAATLANVGDGRVVIESVTAGSAATLQVDTVTGMNYVDLKDVVMNGADTYIGGTSVIRSNVKGVRRGPQTGMSMMGV